MQQVLVLLVVTAALGWARPAPQDAVSDPGSLQPYEYQYDVNVPETGDQKSHTEQRDDAGVVVGNFQVVDPNGDLRKLFYRVEGNSGFVITDQQVMVGFAPPPPDPSTYSGRRSADGDLSQGGVSGGEAGSASGGGAGAGQGGLFFDQSSAGGAGQFGDDRSSQGLLDGSNSAGAGSRFGDDAGSLQAGFGDGDSEVIVASDGFSSSNSQFTSSDGGVIFLDGGSSSEGGSGSDSEGDSLGGSSSEGGSSAEGSASSSGAGGGASGSGSAGGSIGPITSQAAKPAEFKPFEFHGPAFTFSIQRTEPNRFEVKEKIIGHAVEFNTHGGRTRRSAGHLP
ncbi:loricrin-like [Amphibalanus amphitrite]|uniref:loricrin-like n=1 Tax=Amphibalanus amphitrite TaxID=1232801 RepID=UPI001C91FC7A|nr:loricrin-like [Amphibalanus amphitrite]